MHLKRLTQSKITAILFKTKSPQILDFDNYLLLLLQVRLASKSKLKKVSRTLKVVGVPEMVFQVYIILFVFLSSAEKMNYLRAASTRVSVPLYSAYTELSKGWQIKTKTNKGYTKSKVKASSWLYLCRAECPRFEPRSDLTLLYQHISPRTISARSLILRIGPRRPAEKGSKRLSPQESLILLAESLCCSPSVIGTNKVE